MTSNEVTLITELIKGVKSDVATLDTRTDARLIGIETKLEDLIADKWKRYGGGIVVSALVGFGTTLLIAWVTK